MRNYTACPRFLRLLLVIALLLGGVGGDLSWAQDDGEIPIILIVRDGYLSEEQNNTTAELAEELAERLRTALQENEIDAFVEVEIFSVASDNILNRLSPSTPLIIELAPADDRGRYRPAVSTRFWRNTPPSSALLSSQLQNELHNSGIRDFLETGYLLPPTSTWPPIDHFTTGAISAFYFATGQICEVITVENAFDYPYLSAAMCLRAVNEHGNALSVLLEGSEWRRSHMNTIYWPQRILPEVYTADSLAQTFAVDEALVLDSQLIEHVQTRLADPDDEHHAIVESLLPELYLLRAQHRLYLYEWDAVLDDINTALTFENAPPRAYYYRGLTYYSQNEGNTHELAYADFARYLELETDANSPLIAQAERFVETLENTLSTESEGQ